MLALRSLLRGKAVEFKQISSDQISEITRNNQPAATSEKVIKTNVSVYLDNITDPLVCIQQWQENNISLEDAVRCIDKYMRIRNKT